MDNQNCELLFEYLRSILYDSEIHTLDIADLDEPFKKLGMGLQYLEQAVKEMKAYTADLAAGNLSVPCPGRENFLCENLKSLHANLNHLTLQAKLVAAGDYSQKVSYMGEFSEAFNTMIKQLCERDELLKLEAEREKKKADSLEDHAYMDMLTYIGNRYYFEEKTSALLKKHSSFTLCYVDLDHLKYINDKFGHMEGDKYLKDFVYAVKRRIRNDDIFARMGGDEFCIVFLNCERSIVHEKMEQILIEFENKAHQDYPASFSCGIIEVNDAEKEWTISEMLEAADRVMYEQKRIHKQRYEIELKLDRKDI